MKRWIVTLLLLLVACQPSTEAREILPEEPPKILRGSEDFIAMTKQKEDNAALFYPVWKFATKSMALLPREENLNYSPLSAYAALSLLQSGAEKETEEELLKLLGQETPWDVEMTNIKLMDWLRMEYLNEQAVIRMANSLWISDKAKWSPEGNFIHALEDVYHASLHQAHFGTKKTDERIRQWLLEKTDGHLDMDLSCDRQTVLMILNALYYKASWLDVCDKEMVEDLPFTTANKVNIEVPTMLFEHEMHWREEEKYLFVDKALERGTMRFILPKEGWTLENLMEDQEQFYAMLTEKEGEDSFVRLYLPKFDIYSDLDLNEVLQDLGMEQAFIPNQAQFAPMGLGDIYVSQVKQNTRMTVAEDGVEASAVTAIENKVSAMRTETTKEVHLDRPFLFLLNYEDIPLFVGICGNPATE